MCQRSQVSVRVGVRACAHVHEGVVRKRVNVCVMNMCEDCVYVCVLHCLFSRATTQVFVVIGPIANSKGRGGFPGGSDGKESACNARDPDSIPGFGRSPGEGNGNPLQYFCLENSMDRGIWWATVHGVTKSRT